MKTNCIPVAVLIAGAMLTLAPPSHAQISTAFDENGKLVFVNGDSPKPRRGSTISSPSAAGGRSSAMSSEETASTLGATDGRLDRIVRDAAARHQVDPALVKAVISTESGWNSRAVSRKGAVGLMQLIPGTAQRFGVGNPFDPAQNVEGGTSYLKSLLDRYNGDLTKTLAAYNAGEHAVDLSRGVPAYPETQRYVQKGHQRIFSPRLRPRPSALDSAKKSSAQGSGREWPGNFHERMTHVFSRRVQFSAKWLFLALALAFALSASAGRGS